MSLAVVGAIKDEDNAGTEETDTDPSEDGAGVEGIEDEDSAGTEETEADPGRGKFVDPAEVGAIEDNAGIEEAVKVAEVAMTHSEVNLCLFRRFSADGGQELEDAATGGDVREDGSIGRGEDPALQEEEWVGRQLVL